jgi:N-acetylglucosamine-6-phosphate deacetylase
MKSTHAVNINGGAKDCRDFKVESTHLFDALVLSVTDQTGSGIEVYGNNEVWAEVIAELWHLLPISAIELAFELMQLKTQGEAIIA